MSYNRSTFPEQVDSLPELFTLPAEQYVNAERYRVLLAKANKTSDEITELNQLAVTLKNYIIDVETWNKFSDICIGLETFFNSEVQGFITTKQTEFQTEIDKFSDKGIFNPAILYYKNNYVQFNDGSGLKTYLVIVNPPLGTEPTNTTYFRLLTITGAKGENGIGIGLTFRGAWNNSTVYAKDQGCQMGGALFASLINSNVGNIPDLTQDTAYWVKAVDIAITTGELKGIRNLASVTSNVNFMVGDITSFNQSVDSLEVRKNTTVLIEGIQYSINANNQSIDNLEGTWNGTVEPIIFEFVVTKNIVNNLVFKDGSALEDGTVAKSKLTTDVQDTINSIPELSNQITILSEDVGSVSGLNTTFKDNTVGAINEIVNNYVRQPAFATTTGVANTYVITLSPAPTVYVDGMGVTVKINIDSTGASTLNVNSLGAKSLKSATGTDITNLKVNGVYTFRYNATTGNFIVQGEGVDALPLITAVNSILNS